MSGFQCLITGADLYVEDSGMFLHGDLYGDQGVESTTFVFNGVLSDAGEAAWSYGVLLDSQISTRRILIIPNSNDFFERRGVVVVSALESYLNPHALEYVRRAP